MVLIEVVEVKMMSVKHLSGRVALFDAPKSRHEPPSFGLLIPK